jgi:hypothetical protein
LSNVKVEGVFFSGRSVIGIKGMSPYDYEDMRVHVKAVVIYVDCRQYTIYMQYLYSRG